MVLISTIGHILSLPNSLQRQRHQIYYSDHRTLLPPSSPWVKKSTHQTSRTMVFGENSLKGVWSQRQRRPSEESPEIPQQFMSHQTYDGSIWRRAWNQETRLLIQILTLTDSWTLAVSTRASHTNHTLVLRSLPILRPPP